MKEYTVNINWDEESQGWWCECDDAPLNLEAGSYDLLIEKVRWALPDLLPEYGIAIEKGETVPLRFCTEVRRQSHCYG